MLRLIPHRHCAVGSLVPRPTVEHASLELCALADSSDEELIDAANLLRPSGTPYGWTYVVRHGPSSPAPCSADPARRHFLVGC